MKLGSYLKVVKLKTDTVEIASGLFELCELGLLRFQRGGRWAALSKTTIVRLEESLGCSGDF